MNNQIEHSLSPGVISILPLFYIGWSDSVLSPSEMKLIHQKIKDVNFLTEEDKKYLIKYSDPSNPPDEKIFREWLDILRHESLKLPEGEKKSLAELGIDLAKASSHHPVGPLFDAPNTLKALLEIEKELGIYTDEDLKSMLDHLGAYKLKPISKGSSFDPQKMNMILDGNNADTKKKTRKLLRDPFYAIENLRIKDDQRQKTLDMVVDLAERGYGILAYPTEYGGKGDMGEYIAVFQILASHDLSLTIKFGVQFGLFGGTIAKLGTECHHSKYLNAAGKAKLLGCFAMTETGHGSNVKDLETTATYDHNTQTITIHTPTRNAGKEYIGNTLHGSLAVVFAQLLVEGTNHGIHAVLVPYRDGNGDLLEGIEVEDCGYKMGLNGIDNGRLWFNNVKVPVENLLNKYGDINSDGQYISPIENPSKRFFTMLGALVGGRICVGLGALSAAMTAQTIAIKYALRRRQFASKEGEDETLIMDYPSHQQRLIPLLVKTYAYHISLSSLAEQYVGANDEDMRKIETKAAGLKSLATWHGTHTIQECREACGGKGYLWENRFADLKADSDIFTTFEGDNNVLMQLVAKALLTEFKQSFHDEGFKAVIRYLGNKLSNTLVEINPYFTRNTSLEHLMSEDFHSDALRYREKKILIALSDRMRDYLKKRLGPYEAFLKCQIHMLDLAKAYIERLVHRDMIKKIASLEESEEKEILKKIASYYALTIIQENKGWYLEADYMDGSKTKAIRRVYAKLTQELRHEVETMVDAFGIPTESIAAQIVE